MFCPKCGAIQSDELKFCKTCGVNLHAVRQIVEAGGTSDKFDWSKTWVAEMFLSEGERKRRTEELERQRGITPEVKRFKEIKGGVITACVGIALMIFLAIFMEGIVLGGKVPHDEAEILSRIWAVGVIPLLVGVGLLINGVFVSKKQVEIATRERRAWTDGQKGSDVLPEANVREALRAGDTGEIIPPGFSVTEATTKHLSVSGQKVRNADNV